MRLFELISKDDALVLRDVVYDMACRMGHYGAGFRRLS